MNIFDVPLSEIREPNEFAHFYNYAGNRGGVIGEYVRQRRRQRK